MRSGDSDVERIHDAFEPLTARVAARHATLVPGVVAVAEELRRRGIRLGSTTGYTRPIMERVRPLAARQGFATDNLVCAGGPPGGAPDAPHDVPVLRRARGMAGGGRRQGGRHRARHRGGDGGGKLGGRGSRCPATRSASRRKSLRASIRTRRRACANGRAAELRDAGAHYVIDTVADLLPVVEAIDARLAASDTPSVLRTAP